jgi:hypothetical protein
MALLLGVDGVWDLSRGLDRPPIFLDMYKNVFEQIILLKAKLCKSAPL